MKKYLISTIFLILVLTGGLFYIYYSKDSLTPTKGDAKPCKYYAYIHYGTPTLVRDSRVKEKVYRESSVFKAVLHNEIEKRFRACCNDYCSNSCGDKFWIKNIGPYDTEAVCYAELQKQIKLLDAENYKPYQMYVYNWPGMLMMNYEACN